MYFIDVQGTLISDADKSPIEGSIEFISELNRKNIPYMIVTNNTKKKSHDFYEYLLSIGFEISFDKYLDPLMLLETRVDKSSVAAYGAAEFLKTLESMAYSFDYVKPKTVLIAIKEDFSADEYAQMIDFLLAGASLVGMHETSIYAKNSKRYPGVGAILKLLEFATSVSYKVVGKPSSAFYMQALQELQKQDKSAKFDTITMISDDVKGDLGGAKELGMRTIFVTSGKYKSAQEIVPFLDEKLRPDLVYKNMQEIMEKI
ncbi:HAD-IIA family hydrolase [Sulfurimonas sp. SAG-AH-194-L11]|nr:HAD-IIA family hydrolase [Sulfurimonas sp. SAG-AH-194-L11]MDF1876477.1 HAD-IIA family hydrolase [Sulfurimonas sp. SAG-AH-194-L11]